MGNHQIGQEKKQEIDSLIMSTLIKKMLCNHKYRSLSGITAVCDKCGKIAKISCCHEWMEYNRDDFKHIASNPFTGCSDVDYHVVVTLICSKCGEIKQLRTDGRKIK